MKICIRQVIVTLVLVSCSTFLYAQQNDAPHPVAKVRHFDLSLKVSAPIQRYFVPIEKGSYDERETAELFASMRSVSEPFCRMTHQRLPYRRSITAKFIGRGYRKQYETPCPKCVRNVKAGCWNFFRMNDIHPEDDFRFVKKMFPAAAYDCYSVGLMQPYMLHNELGCKNLTMLDFDWRIQDAHFQLLKLYRSGAIGNDQATVDRGLAKMSIGWTAFFKQRRHERPASVEAFCSKRQRHICSANLAAFQENIDMLERIQLSLASLDRVTFFSTAAEVPKVVYLSNAIEDIYTKPKEFRRLMASTRKVLHEGQKAIFIHHVGSRRGFGIYVMEKGPKYAPIKTICRDRYKLIRPKAGPDDYYTTYFEQVTTTKGIPPRCHRLMRKMGLEYKSSKPLSKKIGTSAKY